MQFISLSIFYQNLRNVNEVLKKLGVGIESYELQILNFEI